MAERSRAIASISPWRARSLTVPPQSLSDWLRLVAWEFWMGALVCALLWFGGAMISTAPDRMIVAKDVSGCYALPPVAQPCERTVYRGALNTAFSALSGFMLIVAALWLLWELWDATAPKPITDDFLRLLNDSFARDWRDPRTWPWSRFGWAYGFTTIGAAMIAALAFVMWTALASATAVKPAVVHVETSQDYRVNP
ncbi:MAG TPA: hypothetical protein VFZ31_03790 [Vicinamibacterales bacterium]